MLRPAGETVAGTHHQEAAFFAVRERDFLLCVAGRDTVPRGPQTQARRRSSAVHAMNSRSWCLPLVAVALLTGGCTKDPVDQAQRRNVDLLRSTGVLTSAERLIFQRTMSTRAGEADNAPINGYLTRIEVALHDSPATPEAVQALLDRRAAAGGFAKYLDAKQGGLQPACYQGHGVTLCVLVAGLEQSAASAEISVDTQPLRDVFAVPKPVAILSAKRGRLPEQIEFTADSCHGQLETRIAELPKEITLTVTSTATQGSSSSCTDGDVLQLASPIGDRPLRDLTSGKMWPLAP